MTDKPVSQSPISLSLDKEASALVPFVYFDFATCYGVGSTGSVAHITLEVVRALNVDGKLVNDRVVVAHLRMSAAGYSQLKTAIDGINLLAQPVPQGSVN